MERLSVERLPVDHRLLVEFGCRLTTGCLLERLPVDRLPVDHRLPVECGCLLTTGCLLDRLLDSAADEASNRIEQELLILAFGDRTRPLLRRLKLYKDFAQDPATKEIEFTEKYGDRILQLEREASGCTYIPGDEVAGDKLRSFADKPILSGPLVCQLCDADFTNEKTFALHKKCDHGGEHEYRKRVLYLMAEAGPRPITAQEKRIVVQNFARFQQYCRPGAGGNFFADCEEVPRAEAACVVCAQKDYLEHRYKLCLFEEAPAESTAQGRLLQVDQEADEEEDGTTERHSQHDRIAYSLVKRNGVYYIQSPEKVQAFMNVERYHARWPLIPEEHLHASSVQHPRHPEWRWLLHTRRVPVLPDADVSPLGASVVGADFGTLPKCAGIGDPEGIVWACWPCLLDLCSKKLKIPLDGLVNDNWIGREWVKVRETTEATKTLLSLGRACWKQVRLGRGKPDVQQTGVCGNTIFFAQPTADVPSMELPPPTDALIDSFNIIVTRKVEDLRFATWAVVKREEYLTIAHRRKKECPVFAHVTIKEEEAKTRLPQDGVPEHLRKCVQYVEGARKAPVRMSGPASRAPEVGNNEEAGEESDRSDGPCPFTDEVPQSTLTKMVP